jgi:hypothetical protein
MQAALKDKASGQRLMPNRLYLVRMKNDGDPFLVKDAGYFLVGGLAAFSFVLWAIFDLPSRLKREGSKIRLLEILTATFLTLVLVRYVLKLFA